VDGATSAGWPDGRTWRGRAAEVARSLDVAAVFHLHGPVALVDHPGLAVLRMPAFGISEAPSRSVAALDPPARPDFTLRSGLPRRPVASTTRPVGHALRVVAVFHSLTSWLSSRAAVARTAASSWSGRGSWLGGAAGMTSLSSKPR